jgi:hypothetical protein
MFQVFGIATFNRHENVTTNEVKYAINITHATFNNVVLNEPPIPLPNGTLAAAVNKVINMGLPILNDRLAAKGLDLPAGDGMFADIRGKIKILPYPTSEVFQVGCGTNSQGGYIDFISYCDKSHDKTVRNELSV